LTTWQIGTWPAAATGRPWPSGGNSSNIAAATTSVPVANRRPPARWKEIYRRFASGDSAFFNAKHTFFYGFRHLTSLS
jgi:hypothetical protein